MNNETLTADQVKEQLDKATSKAGLRLIDITDAGVINAQAALTNDGIVEIPLIRINAELVDTSETKLIALLSPEGAEDLAADLLDAAAKVRERIREIDRQSGIQEKTALN